eukprot:CAMPEP_0177683052 /NCGR_PEP_ID=MMETSP0447-20121125/31586_1 /TAXON_ID=0 /ORGANISM="Stygamoeba regulata, Strain BSH-02190019" /LENGTH=513 /DNA_ID=CAMNT_0019192595 /DNA_START=68 /DNA_END=1609 /DNA_ORIENTATION=+
MASEIPSKSGHRQVLRRSLTMSLVSATAGIEGRIRGTKIICTIGPKTNSIEMLGKLLDAGMNVVRMNFSHGSHAYHKSVIDNLHAALEVRPHRTCAVMLDTKGPEIRTCSLKKNADGTTEKLLTIGSRFVLTSDTSVVGDENIVATTYANLPKVVNVGNIILIDDGLLAMRVLKTSDTTVECEVLNEGHLDENKGVNLPGVKVDLPAVTDKDKEDIAFGVEQGVDFIAASFIRKAADVEEILNLPGVRDANIKIISKIENQEGLENFAEILAVTDGIMVARGDLGVEIPIERVASAQKMMINKCNFAGKPVITATQMLESMIVNPRPTRAEATDVANAVFDGTDAVMLSGESAKGAYPVEAVETMARICVQAEKDIDHSALFAAILDTVRAPVSIPESVASSAVKSAWDLGACLIVSLTETGSTVAKVSKYRPACPILGVSPNKQTLRQMCVYRGAIPYTGEVVSNDEKNVLAAVEYAKLLKLIKPGETSIMISGVLQGKPGSTNLMRVVQVE